MCSLFVCVLAFIFVFKFVKCKEIIFYKTHNISNKLSSLLQMRQ